MDVQTYWIEVGQTERSLPSDSPLYLISLDDPQRGIVGGVVVDMDASTVDKRKLIARRLVEKTHRLARPEEIDAYLAQIQRQTAALAEIELKRKQQFALPAELQTLVATAAAIVQRDTDAAAARKGR